MSPDPRRRTPCSAPPVAQTFSAAQPATSGPLSRRPFRSARSSSSASNAATRAIGENGLVMNAMVLTRLAAGRLDAVERAVPEPPTGHVRIQVRACGVCRTDLHVVDGELPRHPRADRAGPRNRRRRRAVGDGVDGLPAGRPRRRPVARLLVRRSASTAAAGARTCAPMRAIHRLPHRRRVCGVHGRRCTLHLQAAGRLQRRRGSAAAVRRADRLSCVPHGAAMEHGSASTGSARPPTSSRRSPSMRAARCSRSRRPATRRRRRSRASSGCAWAGGQRGAARAARRGDHLRAGRRARARSAVAHVAPGGMVVCAGIHMSDIPSFPYPMVVGGTRGAIGRESDAT